MNIRFYIPEQTIGPAYKDEKDASYISAIKDSLKNYKASLVEGITLMFDSEEEIAKYHDLAMNAPVANFAWINDNPGVKTYTERETKMMHELSMKNDQISQILSFIDTFGSSNNTEHLQWVLDQVVRGLCDGKAIVATDSITVKGFGCSELYRDWVHDHCYDENDEQQWIWPTGQNIFE